MPTVHRPLSTVHREPEGGMGQVRIVPKEQVASPTSCSRCDAGEGPWDWIGTKAYCPACEEALLMGEIGPLVERTTASPCVICHRAGSISVTTYPLQTDMPVQFDLCADHIRALMGRRLGPHAYFQLRRQLRHVGLEAEDIFLLHEAFYNDKGHALAPIPDPE